MTEKIAITGSKQGQTRYYVDPRAADGLEDGSAQRPFTAIEDALAVIQDPTTPSMAQLKTIDCTGVFGTVTLDRPCVLKGPAIFTEINITNHLVVLDNIIVGTLNMVDSEDCRLQNIDVGATLTMSGSNALVFGARINKLVLAAAGNLELNLATVFTACAIPAEWTVVAYNSVLKDASGTYTAYNVSESSGT